MAYLVKGKGEEQGYLRQEEDKTLHHLSKKPANNVKTKLKDSEKISCSALC